MVSVRAALVAMVLALVGTAFVVRLPYARKSPAPDADL